LSAIFDLYYEYNLPSEPVVPRKPPIDESGYHNVFMSMVGTNSPLTTMNHLLRADRLDIYAKYAAKVIRNA